MQVVMIMSPAKKSAKGVRPRTALLHSFALDERLERLVSFACHLHSKHRMKP